MLETSLASKNKLIYTLIVVLVALVLFQFFQNRNLWLDEAMLALNIQERTFTDLLLPLDHLQSAPILYLWVIKLFYSINSSDLAIRLPTLLAFFGGLYFLNKFLKTLKVQNSDFILLLCMSNPLLFYYSNELKPYMLEFFWFFYVLYFFVKKGFKWSTPLILGGVIAIFSANGVVILFPILVLIWGWNWFFKRHQKLTSIVSIIAWFIALGMVYFFFVKDSPLKDHMLTWWQYRFMPINVFSYEFIVFVGESLQDIGGYILGFQSLWYVLIPLLTIGFWSQFKKREFLLLFLIIGVLIVHLSLSALKIYPFYNRFILYSVPFFYFLCFGGLFFLLQKLKVPYANWIVFSLFFFLNLQKLYNNYPYYNEEVVEAVESVDNQNTIVLDSFTTKAFSYYANKGLLHQKPIFIKNRSIDPGFEQEIASIDYPYNFVVTSGHGQLQRVIELKKILTKYGIMKGHNENAKKGYFIYSVYPKNKKR